jgi:6-phosphogluconolactonase
VRVRDAEEASREAARRFVALAADALRDRGRFSVALSGGSTPRRLHQLLAAPPYREALDWSRVEFFQGDERGVPPEHAESNWAMARETLLDAVDARPERRHRMEAERADRDAAARDYERELARVLGAGEGRAPPRVDLVQLGLGDDGHTASLFPHAATLREERRWVVPARSPKPPHERLTFTFPMINRARCVLFLVVGAAKAPPLAAVLEGPRDPERLPAQRVAPSDGALVWVADDAAAARLGRS